ncbi:class A beta-lactamase-related serine hydrolase [Actinophytocola gossypii]|uniref:Serine hydrolase n=1 Tax=Actinophytocola gossypii TaxID=2812003 RepID=A0ABT2J5T7_9PSEU|nr:class A beta-lactamase-related serine hydrolase [Actinophytocola gossypii]MCT2582624.1 serine hydrolase [Actinophytocola gossypii]
MRRLVTTVLVLVALVVPSAPAVASPPATAEEQLAWFVDASARAPVSEAEQRAHLSAEFLAAIGGPAAFNETLTGLGPLTLDRIVDSSPASLQAVLSDFLVVLAVDDAGLVSTLQLTPHVPSPQSWSELDSRLRTLAPQVSFTTSSVDDGCRPIHEVDGNRARPLGSAFKLYVLSALGRAVADGRASWDQNLPIRDEWKSLPSGVLQDRPAGTPVTLREHANLMISISDNTATDHLVHFLGRRAVLREMTAHGNDRDRNKPLLTTRELFTLKGFRYPALADTYLSFPRGLRAALLPVLNEVPRERIVPWTEPRDIGSIEWFGSPTDMCRILAGLRSLDDPAVATAMSISDGQIGLDRDEFPTVWFKGGSEPGVLTVNYLARTADGRTLVSSVMLADPDGALDPSITPKAIALARGGLELA